MCRDPALKPRINKMPGAAIFEEYPGLGEAGSRVP